MVIVLVVELKLRVAVVETSSSPVKLSYEEETEI